MVSHPKFGRGAKLINNCLLDNKIISDVVYYNDDYNIHVKC